ncbi:chloride channel protein [Waterburya agarophytonicola K14]|uniref:Chloride channel protein n=1 Tax=Waterburya agarophytonicola KI4 TaxID=2874699 RepID=A0A964BRV3_9CYAN|nr:chloride channel protein [Waterburya agarophytonicola]MCC0178474.1 chloride channel protein [Waterburya agarophytonicola KI4]
MKKLLANWRQSSWLASSSLDTRYALIEACLIGLFSALAAVLLKQGIGWLGGYRIKAIELGGARIVLPLAGLIFGTLAGGIIELLSPSAAGGGIPQVKAALAKYPIILNLRVALVKTVATILIIGAGFTLGRRGPTVHIGAALGAQVSRWIPNSPTNRRQMIAAGAAAGLAAGFNTPIAGVLFVVEELMRDISGLTLETAIAASFTGAVVSRILGSTDLNVPLAVIDSARRGSFAIPEIPFYVVLGILAGILGGVFNRSIIRGVKFSRSLALAIPLRIGLAGLISGTIVAWLPPFFQDNAGLRELLIAGQFTWQTTALVFVAQFCLTILAYSAGAPGGLFAPALVLGSALGYLVGIAEVAIIHSESPYTFAFAGMAAFFTAVVRVPVTAIVIIFEMTADFNLVLPLMITSAVAYIVAESFSQGSLYEHLLEASGIEITEEHPQNDFMSELTADDVMESRVETLPSDLTLPKLIQAMSRSHHRGFPVVEDGKLVGIITQSDIPKDSKQNSEVLLQDIMTPQPISVCPDTSLADVLYLLNRYQLSRLPVTEGSKLLGIITRSDIIKAEANQLNCDLQRTTISQPSYVVYQTRSPATGKGRLLLPLGNPDNLASLLEIAGAIAKYHQYEVEFLRVTCIANHIYPAQAEVEIAPIRQLMESLENWGKKSAIPVHTQIRVATDVGEAILEAINKEHIDLLLMGWKGKNSGIEAIFSNVVDYLIKEAPCNLMLVKLGKSPHAFPQQLHLRHKWLIPTTGGDRINKLLTILPALSQLDAIPPKIQLCQVYLPEQAHLSQADFKHAANVLQEQLQCSITPLRISSYSVSKTIINLTKNKKYGLVLLGASNKGLLQNVIEGNIPQAIATESPTTVIIFRSFD